MLSYSLCVFYLRRLHQDHPVPFAGMVAGFVILSFGLCVLFGFHAQTTFLLHEKARLNHPHAIVASAEPSNLSIVLPPLRSAVVVKSFNGIANDMHVPLEEVAYALDNSSNTPYLRYRITLTTKAGYAEIRKFLAALASEMPNVALDSIHCGRADATVNGLGCELAFSAFFSKTGHG